MKPLLGQQINRGHPLARGLVGCWLFNEGSGNKVFDLSGYGNTGTLVADTHFVPGKFGSALEFDGTGDYIQVPDNSSLSFTNETFSISLWFKSSSSVDMAFLYKGSDANNREYFYNLSAIGAVRIRIFDNDNSYQTTTAEDKDYADGDWHHTVAVADGSNLYIYVDNALKDSDAITVSMADLGSDFYIGEYGGGSSYYNGYLDAVMIFNKALTQNEIDWLYREPFCMFKQRLPRLLVSRVRIPVAIHHYQQAGGL